MDEATEREAAAAIRRWELRENPEPGLDPDWVNTGGEKTYACPDCRVERVPEADWSALARRCRWCADLAQLRADNVKREIAREADDIRARLRQGSS